MTEQLKPCPFCGSEPHDAHHIEYGRWAVTCKCGVMGACANTGPNASDAAKIKAYNDARHAWNTRALTTPQPAQAGEVDERAAFEARVVKEAGEGAIAKWLGTEGYENTRVQDNRLGWVWCLEHLASLPTQPAAQADSMGMPTSCGKPLCSPNEHHALCKLHKPAAQATPEPDTCRKRPRCGRADPCAWLDKQATQQAAGEPVGELTATLPDGIGFDVRWLAHSGPTLKVGDRIYTHPAPGVPEGWREVIEKMVKGIDHLAELARQWEPDYSSGADRKGWVLAKNARDEAVDMLAAAQAKGGADA